MAGAGGDEADQDAEDVGGGEWGDGVQLGFDGGVFETFYYRGEEVG